MFVCLYSWVYKSSVTSKLHSFSHQVDPSLIDLRSNNIHNIALIYTTDPTFYIKMTDDTTRANILFNRTGHFDWSPLTAQHGADAIVDYRRFLAVKVLDGDLGVGDTLRHGPGARVDEVWHSHLLIPSHYASVCAALTGSHGVLVEHNPETAERSDVAMRTEFTARRVQELFGQSAGRASDVGRPGSGMEIIVKTEDGTSHTLKVQTSDTIKDLRHQIEATIGIPTGLQRIIIDGDRVYSGTLRSHNIENGAIVRVVSRKAPC